MLRVQACGERAHELAGQLPKLQAEAAKAAQDMSAAQQQSEASEITDEAREALLERIQALTTSESEVKQRLSDAEQVPYNIQAPESCCTCSSFGLCILLVQLDYYWLPLLLFEQFLVLLLYSNIS